MCIIHDDKITLTGAISYSNSRFGNGMGPILLDNLYCRGNESTLLGCTHPGLGVHNCNHAQDAGVACIRKCLILIV